ncbi:MAG TPA: cation:proton antiporter [Chloroflexia bacterium]
MRFSPDSILLVSTYYPRYNPRNRNMHDFPILVNITIALLVAFAGGLLARYLKLPTLVGYLLAGVAIGPFTPGFVGDLHTIQEMAELGVIFLLFGVGLHFSLRDLWTVRRIAVPGALLQMALSTGLGLLLSLSLGWPLQAGIIIGLAISIASTVVLLRNLMDQGLLNTPAGQVAIGWLVLEDLATVLILVLLPALSTTGSEPLWQTAGLALLKTAAFAGLMLIVGTRGIPWFLLRIAHLRSRELFIIAIVVITLGTAVGAATLFGVSLALGAFLAGVVVSESALSHQVEAEILPFRETFAVLFFVSVGMLVNPLQLVTNGMEVLAITVLIVLGKGLLTVIVGLLLARSARTALVIAVSLAQIGEFSFLLGQAGIANNLLTQDQYSLLLAGALFSITLNPFLFRALPWLEARLLSMGMLRSLTRNDRVTVVPVEHSLSGHVVIIGYGRVGKHLVNILTQLEVPRLVVELDVTRLAELESQNVPVLFGDAASSNILAHAHVERAREVVVTLPDEASAASVVATVRATSPDVPLVVRATTQASIQRLLKLGATEVVYPELVGGLEMMYQTLLRLGYPKSRIDELAAAIRADHYDLSVSSRAEQEALAQMQGTLDPER